MPGLDETLRRRLWGDLAVKLQGEETRDLGIFVLDRLNMLEWRVTG